MKKLTVLIFLSLNLTLFSQNYGDFPKISKEKLLRDIDLLYQGLDSYHTGMYWYSSKDSVDLAFEFAKSKLDQDLNVLEFHKIIAPLISISREAHTELSLSESIKENIESQAIFLPITVIFLDEELYCLRNGSNKDSKIEGRKILSINGETTKEIFEKVRNLFASDGYIEGAKYSRLIEFNFSKRYYHFYGNIATFKIEFEDKTIDLEALKINAINENLSRRYIKTQPFLQQKKESVEFRVIDDSIAYLGLHTFSNDKIKKNSINNNFNLFLEKSFETINSKDINTLIIDLSKNSGGNEGNENLVYSYIGNNYQKYKKVKAKTQKMVLDNGIDQPIKFKTFGFLEKLFANKKMSDGSFERKKNVGLGLMAYKKAPKYKFNGKLYIIISPFTYSGGSELSNMIYSNNLATFVGEETGGGYYGNTSGYSNKLTLPNSGIGINIPALQFVMNVKESIPFGRGVIPDHEVIPTVEQFINAENPSLNYILNLIKKYPPIPE